MLGFSVRVLSARCGVIFIFCVASVLLTHMGIPTYFEFSGKIPLNFKQNTCMKLYETKMTKTVLAGCLCGSYHH